MLLPRRRALPSEKLCRAFGVTRIARITGLDRTGVEVACAVRPHGHVLQVSNGKGRTFEHAAATALSEAAELSSCERVDTRQFIYGSFNQLRDAGAVWPDPAIAGESQDLLIAWTRATDLHSRRTAWVPAQFVHCPPPGAFLGPAIFRWTSNGVAAHRTRALAIRHALYEVMERDQLARALPDGWTPKAIRARRVVPPGTLKQRVEDLRGRGFEIALFDLRSEKSAPAPAVAGALLFDLEEGPIPMTAGYACAATMTEALESALLEAAQSRLTDIHGAREDVAPANREEATTMRELCAASKPRELSTADESRSRRAKGLVAGSRSARDIWVVELATEPLHVVRVIVPGLRISELL